jgi:hypothetical protein
MVRLSCWTSSSGCWTRRVRSRWNLWRARFERSHSALRTRAASGLFQTDLSIRDGPNRSTQRSLNRPLASTCNVSCRRASRWPVPKNGFLRIDEWKSSGVSARTPLLYGCSVICFGRTPWGVDLAGRCARSAGRTSVGEGDRAAIAAESERWSFKPGRCPPRDLSILRDPARRELVEELGSHLGDVWALSRDATVGEPNPALTCPILPPSVTGLGKNSASVAPASDPTPRALSEPRQQAAHPRFRDRVAFRSWGSEHFQPATLPCVGGRWRGGHLRRASSVSRGQARRGVPAAENAFNHNVRFDPGVKLEYDRE